MTAPTLKEKCMHEGCAEQAQMWLSTEPPTFLCLQHTQEGVNRGQMLHGAELEVAKFLREGGKTN
jgi:hypothetical protein